jgi:hypothetical protein
MMPGAASVRKRSRLELVFLFLVPIAGNLLLAAILFARLPTTVFMDGASPTPLPLPSTLDLVPQSSLTAILAAVDGSTGHSYSCQGPWQTHDGWFNWECRTDQALVTVVGADALRIARLDATWFGFEETKTDLPAWAAAVQRIPDAAGAAGAWVAGALGGVASVEISKVRLVVGGARGALNLRIQAEAATQ